MNCESWRQQIALEVEGDLASRKSRGVKKHVEICPACRRFARELTESQAILKGLGHEPIDGKVFGTIQQKVLDEIASRRATCSSICWNWHWTGAISMLLLLGGLALWRFTQPGSSGHVGGPRAHLGRESNGLPASEVDDQLTVKNQEFATTQMVNRKLMTVQKHRPGTQFPKSSDRSQGSGAITSQKLSREPFMSVGGTTEDENEGIPPLKGVQGDVLTARPRDTPRRPRAAAPLEGGFSGEDLGILSSQTGKEKTSLEVAKAEAQERKAQADSNITDTDPMVIKLLTDDPEIVIVWLVDQKGGVRK